MRRTTIRLDEAVYRRVRALAEERGWSLARTIDDLVRESLDGGHRVGPRAEPPLHRGNGPRAGVDVSDRDRLYDLMEGR